MKKMNKEEIIIYDGVCILCNSFIRYILKKDYNSHFKITNLQSKFTKTRYPEVLEVDSVAVILRSGKILQKSKAVYYIFNKIKILFIIRAFIYVLPTFLSNAVYDFIAMIRYKLFGKYPSCPVIEGHIKNRVIE